MRRCNGRGSRAAWAPRRPRRLVSKWSCQTVTRPRLSPRSPRTRSAWAPRRRRRGLVATVSVQTVPRSLGPQPPQSGSPPQHCPIPLWRLPAAWQRCSAGLWPPLCGSARGLGCSVRACEYMPSSEESARCKWASIARVQQRGAHRCLSVFLPVSGRARVGCGGIDAASTRWMG